MNKIETNSEQKCPCPVETTTAHHEEYQKYDKVPTFQVGKAPEHCDFELSSGYYQNNLKYNGQQMKSRIWPDILPHSEEYMDFLKRFQKCRKELFDLYFKLPPVDKEVIGEMFNNLNKTSYQLCFSPECFVPRTERRRFAKLERLPIKYEETTYRTYYNHINELEHLRDVLRAVASQKDKEKLKKDMLKIKYPGRSTYNDEISVLGKVYAKPTLPAPIDRYTLRRI